MIYASPADDGNERGMRSFLAKLTGKIANLARVAVARLRILLRQGDADLYHFRDPELLPLAFTMKMVFGKHIVSDCYEDFASMAYAMRGLPSILRPAMAGVATR